MTQTSTDANKRLDAVVAQKIFGAVVKTSAFAPKIFFCDFPNKEIGQPWIHLPPFSSDLSLMDSITKQVGKQRMSVQMAYVDALEAAARRRIGEVENPLQILFYIYPEDLCRAALLAFGVIKDFDEEIQFVSDNS